MKNRTSADTVDRHAVNKVRLGRLLSGTYDSGEEAQAVGLQGRISQPTQITADAARLVHWQESYGRLWQLKVALEKQNNR